MRKFIQMGWDSEGILHALCDDGSIWYLYDGEEKWYKLADTPQDKPKEIPPEEKWSVARETE